MTPDGDAEHLPGPAGRVATSLPALIEHVAAQYGLGTWSAGRCWRPATRIATSTCGRGGRGWSSRSSPQAARPAFPRAPPTSSPAPARQACGTRRCIATPAAGTCMNTTATTSSSWTSRPASSFYEMGRPPSDAELGKVLEQAALIHAIDARPEPVFDPWAIDNLVPLARQVGGLLDAEQRRLVGGCLEELAGVRWRELPEALIHADLTAGNIAGRPRRGADRAGLRARQPLAPVAGVGGDRGQLDAWRPGLPAGAHGARRREVLPARAGSPVPGASSARSARSAARRRRWNCSAA